MSRIYNRVGEVLDAGQLSQLDNRGVRKFDTLDDANQFILDNPVSGDETYVGSLCIVLSEDRIYGYALDDAGVGSWQLMSQPARSLEDIKPKSGRVPHLPVRWENARGVLSVAELLAAEKSGHSISDHKVLDADEVIVGQEVHYTVTSSGLPVSESGYRPISFVAAATTTLEFVLVGGGGSGSGAAFLGSYEVGGVSYASAGVAGSGGAAGLIQTHRVDVVRGDELEIVLGKGGDVGDLSEGGPPNRVSVGAAGGDTVIRLNKVEVARARGGCGGIRPDTFPVDSGMLSGNSLDGGYNAAQAGGGINSVGFDAWGLGATPHFPEGWKSASLSAPFGARVRAGVGFRVTADVEASARVSASTEQWVIQGGGSEGVSTTSVADTSAGSRAVFAASASNSTILGSHPRIKTAGLTIDWGGVTLVAGQSGAPSFIMGSVAKASESDLAGVSVVTDTSFGYGGDAGAAWRRAVTPISGAADGVPSPDSYTIAVAQNGGDGVCLIKHSLPVSVLPVTPDNHTYKA